MTLLGVGVGIDTACRKAYEKVAGWCGKFSSQSTVEPNNQLETEAALPAGTSSGIFKRMGGNPANDMPVSQEGYAPRSSGETNPGANPSEITSPSWQGENKYQSQIPGLGAW